MTYTDYLFTVSGINFVSRISADSPNHLTISRLPEGVFIQMNIEAVQQLIGDVSLLTLDEIQTDLDRLNEGGTHSFILLGENA
jgi:hypothetical protein